MKWIVQIHYNLLSGIVMGLKWALVAIVDDMLQEMVMVSATLLVLLDVLVVFNNIDHCILLNCLSFKPGRHCSAVVLVLPQG